MSDLIELQRTRMDDKRFLVEVIRGNEVIACAPYAPEDEASRIACVDKLKRQSPGIQHSKIDLTDDVFADRCIKPTPMTELVNANPSLREPIIEGILRRGETCNIIAASKVGKSFLAAGLALSVATGREWLARQVTKCKVLIIDNELHDETLADRLKTIADAMGINQAERSGVDVVPLRGLGIDINSVGMHLSIPEAEYGIVIVDALYRWLPDGCSENDNAEMMRVYNQVDELAAKWGAAVVIVHHASKGDQSDKAVTDVGSGAGAISRAADTHLTIRPHETPELCVLEAVTRSFPRPEPISLRYSYPVWSLDAAVPTLKIRKTPGAVTQAKKDEDGKKQILEAMADGKWRAKRALRAGMGDGRLDRLLKILIKEGEVETRTARRKGSRQKRQLYRLACVGVGSEIGTDQNHTSIPEP